LEAVCKNGVLTSDSRLIARSLSGNDLFRDLFRNLP
jgi:hypothetical protein